MICLKSKCDADQRGFTLIETLVAITIVAVALLGLGALVTSTVQNNQKNELRGIAQRLSAETAAALRTQPFDRVITGDLDPYDGTNVALNPDFQRFPNPQQTIRSGNRTFTVGWVVNNLSDDLHEIIITVRLQTPLKGQDFTNVTTIYRNRDS